MANLTAEQSLMLLRRITTHHHLYLAWAKPCQTFVYMLCIFIHC